MYRVIVDQRLPMMLQVPKLFLQDTAEWVREIHLASIFKTLNAKVKFYRRRHHILSITRFNFWDYDILHYRFTGVQQPRAVCSVRSF